MDLDNKIENHYKSFETPLREGMKNMDWEITMEHTEMMLGHYPGLDRKELCVCLGFCSAVWDTNYYTSYDIVVDYSLREGKSWFMQVEGEPLFANEQEVREVIDRLKEKGIIRSNVGYTINGFRGNCRSRICPKVFYHLERYLNMKPEIEDDAWLTVSRSFERAVQSAFGPIQPEK